jgi:hypothetical protein
MVYFSQLPAVKNTPFLMQVEKILGPSYFVTALVDDKLHSFT